MPDVKMPFRMRNAVPADIPDLCAVYFSAFANTVVGRHVFPPTSENSKKFWSESLAEDLDNPHVQLLVVVTGPAADGSEEHVVGFAKWVRPGAPIDMPPPAEAWPQDGNPQLAVEFFGTMAAGHKRLMGDQPHWYLELIGVRQEWMGKGAASPMMRWGVERADKDGLPCFLDATPAGKGMYEKYGFRVLKEQEFDSPYGKFVGFFMFRDARTGASADKAHTPARGNRPAQSKQGVAVLWKWIYRWLGPRSERP